MNKIVEKLKKFFIGSRDCKNCGAYVPLKEDVRLAKQRGFGKKYWTTLCEKCSNKELVFGEEVKP